MNIAEILNVMTPELYRKFQAAIEIGKWANGKELTVKQKEICMQAVIVYEYNILTDNERTGFVPRIDSQCEVENHNIKATDGIEELKKIKLTQL